MSLLGFPPPGPPDFAVDIGELEDRFNWLANLQGCPQPRKHHAEGDVLTHTRMVIEALLSSERYRSLNESDRDIVFAAALLHDVAKPAVTKEELDQLTSRGHSIRGEIMGRRILWELDAPIAAREHVCQLIRWHEAPFFLAETSDSTRRVITLSHVLSNELLAILATADARGRMSENQNAMLENIALFAEVCTEEQCFTHPFRFASDVSRFEYFRTPSRDPWYEAFDETRCEMTLMSGLPGAGKDHWLQVNAPSLPVVSLDNIRRELGTASTRSQGAVVQAARERARQFLRNETNFAWSATNLSRKIRSSVIDLAAQYKARVRIQTIDVSTSRLFAQNRSRKSRIPDAAYASLLSRWQMPDVTEAHEVMWNDQMARWF